MKSRLNRLEQLCDIVSLEEGLLDKGKDLLRRYDKDQRFIRGLGKLALAYVGAGELDDQLELIKPAGYYKDKDRKVSRTMALAKRR